MSPNAMLGHHCVTGPGGRDCTCCHQAPGKERRLAKRSVKRREKQQLRRAVSSELEQRG